MEEVKDKVSYCVVVLCGVVVCSDFFVRCCCLTVVPNNVVCSFAV